MTTKRSADHAHAQKSLFDTSKPGQARQRTSVEKSAAAYVPASPSPSSTGGADAGGLRLDAGGLPASEAGVAPALGVRRDEEMLFVFVPEDGFLPGATSRNGCGRRGGGGMTGSS